MTATDLRDEIWSILVSKHDESDDWTTDKIMEAISQRNRPPERCHEKEIVFRVAEAINWSVWHQEMPSQGTVDYAFALQHAEAAILALSQLNASNGVSEGWRTIESAPKDGSRIDVWAHWPENGQSKRTADAYWNGRNWQLGQYNETQYAHPPIVSHWRPKPSAPLTDQKAGS